MNIRKRGVQAEWSLAETRRMASAKSAANHHFSVRSEKCWQANAGLARLPPPK
jgi:hypothetical protein